MHEVFKPSRIVEQRAWSCIRRNHLRVDEARITALLELFKALCVKFYENYRARVGFDVNLNEF